jgi:hypothetical protein
MARVRPKVVIRRVTRFVADFGAFVAGLADEGWFGA